MRACCLYSGEPRQFVSMASFQEYWSGSEMNNLRKSLIAGQFPSGCGACERRESALGTSRRHWYLNNVSTPSAFLTDPEMQLRQIDLNFGNTCNLRCRMCGSWGSHLWEKEDRHLAEISKDFERHVHGVGKKFNFSHPEQLDEIRPYLQNIERIDFKGGEPLLHEEMYAFLRKLIDWGMARQVTLAYTTNGTHIDERLEELWPRFKKIKLTVSIEAVGKLYGYIRGGRFSLENLEKNLSFFSGFSNLKGSYNVAISNYNLFGLGHLLDWMKSKRLDNFTQSVGLDCYVISPSYLCVDYLPFKIRAEAREYLLKFNHVELSKFLEGLQSTRHSKEEVNEKLSLFVRFTDEIDGLRKENFLDLVPGFREVFEEERARFL